MSRQAELLGAVAVRRSALSHATSIINLNRDQPQQQQRASRGAPQTHATPAVPAPATRPDTASRREWPEYRLPLAANWLRFAKRLTNIDSALINIPPLVENSCVGPKR